MQVLTVVGLQISTSQSPKVADVALDVIGRWLVVLFHPNNTGGFLLQHLESSKCNTSCLPFTQLCTTPRKSGELNTLA
jgi:hypothetical protein